MIGCKASSSQFNLEPLSRQFNLPPKRSTLLPQPKSASVSASFCRPRPRWSSPTYAANSSSSNGSRVKKLEAGDEEQQPDQRKVQCEVEVISWRERKVKAEILVNADIDSLWDVLTDYERLADFIPNLICSGRIPCPHPGRIWLEQRGQQQALYWHIEARVVLDLQEIPKSPSERDLHFSMVDGDFKKFEGKWSLKMGTRSSTTWLTYEVSVIPRFNFPTIFLERIIRSDLPVNLQALAFRAERNFEGTQKLKMTNSPTRKLIGGFTPIGSNLQGSLLNEKKLSPNDLKDSVPSSSGANPLPPTVPELNNNWGVFGKVCRLDKPCMVDEVHLRRLDGLLENGGVHRCVVASITVKAPVGEVWNVLTAYESLPEIVPNLAISKILSRENNRVRILQEGCKGLLYMVLHARVVLDLCEQLEQEISFEQVEGDFDSFRGKWILEQLGNQHTLLKYTVESKMRKDSFLSEAIMEEVIYEDLPSNLCAIRDYIEKRGESESETSDEDRYERDGHISSSSSVAGDKMASGSGAIQHTSNSHSQSSASQRQRVPGLQRDTNILKAELLNFIKEHGQEGFMPMRKQLRQQGRVDIEKAITRMGGFRRIASMLNLSLAYKHRKPKGYWDKLENLEDEISRFQRSWGMDPSYMPSRKSFERAGSYDIARALEKWGGLHEVSRLLSLKVRHPNRQSSASSRDRKMESSSVVVEKDGEGGEKKSPPSSSSSSSKSKPTNVVSQDTHKWLFQLKHLDINWVE